MSIIIVNYNVKYFLEQCLCSVIKACKNIDAEIIVVDNNSTDGSEEFLTPKFLSVNFIWNRQNLGFAKANNQALKIAKGDYILFLNPDTLVPEDCFENCIEFFKTHSNAGAVGVCMVDGSGKFLKESKRSFPSPLISLFKLSGLAQLFPHSKIFAKYYLGHLPKNKTHEVDVLAGAFMMVPQKVLASNGGFDEIFFMYGEDIDLSYRIQQAGYKNYYFAQTTIIHFKGESTKKDSLNYVKLFYGAMSLFAKKHYRGAKAGVFIFFIQFAILVRAMLAVAAKFFKKRGLPFLDALIIFISFWCIKYLWNTYVRKEINYSPSLLLIAFPIFSIIFLLASYYTGLYDKGYKQEQLNRSTLSAALVLLSGYALLPESIRFSRGILVFGILLAFIIMSLLRNLFVRCNLLDRVNSDEKYWQTLIVAGENDFKTVSTLMNTAGLTEKILGRVGHSKKGNAQALGHVGQLNFIIKKYFVKEIIFCNEELNFKEIIAIIQHLPRDVRNKFHATGSNSFVGSDSKDNSGEYISVNQKFIIESPQNKRIKNLLDVVVAVFFLLSFPVHFFVQKSPFNFFKNIFLILAKKKTWVGYSIAIKNNLPVIKSGVITCTGLPAPLNDLPTESLALSDDWYATHYSAGFDLQKIIKGYKYLGY